MDAQFIRDMAREVLRELYVRRYEVWAYPPFPLEMIEPSIIARLLGVRYEEPEEIYYPVSDAFEEPRYYQIAGLMDPEKNVIAVAGNLRPDVRRFTAAHEIGHYVLHANQSKVLFRDHPLSGTERLHRNRPPVEKEADLFAAELLMPERPLRDAFHAYFGVETLVGVRPSEDLASWLSYGTNRVVTLRT